MSQKRLLRSVILLFLLHYARPTIYAAEGGPHRVQYDNNDEQMVDLIRELALANGLDRRQNPLEFEQVGFDDDEPASVEIELKNDNPPRYSSSKNRKLSSSKSLVAQKKGQNEFVEFVEPKDAQQQINKQIMDKRVPLEQSASSHIGFKSFGQSGNFLFVAMITVCLVGVVAGVTTGGYFFYRTHLRHQKSTDDLDFAHYAPTGPGKSKKKKGGDEGLAYKAQLHHYQQTKQKIISGESGSVNLPDQDETDEASDDDMNNFSVYECPGLAPTGDIEVQNPNFVTRPQ